MFNSKNKTKQNFTALIKFLLVSISCWYIFSKLKQDYAHFEVAFEQISTMNTWVLSSVFLLLILCSFFNWFFEILKWKILVSAISNISFKSAAIQSLTAHAVAIFTPNRVGDFGAKMLFFETKYFKRIAGLNLLNNIAQMSATIAFGILGLVFVNTAIFPLIETHQFYFWLAFSLSIAFFLLMFKMYNAKYFNQLKANLFLAKNKKKKLFIFAFVRYLFFSHQYFFIGWVLGWEVSYFTAMPFIFVLYFIASILPSIFVLDSALKAGIGVYLFSTIGVSSFIIISIATLMWLLNFALPAMIGNILMYKTKFKLPDFRHQMRTD